jgi:hypothetical protein
MYLATTLTMELRVGFSLEEEERLETVVHVLHTEFEQLGMKEHACINTEPREHDDGFVLLVYVTIPDGLDVVVNSPALKRMQTALHAAFMAAQRPPPGPEQLH